MTVYTNVDIIMSYANQTRQELTAMISELKEELQRIEKKLKALRGYL